MASAMIGPSTHGVDIGYRVRRCNPSEIARIIHDGHEEIGGRNDASLVVDLPDSCVVTGFGSDQKLCVRRRWGLAGEKLLQDRRS